MFCYGKNTYRLFFLFTKGGVSLLVVTKIKAKNKQNQHLKRYYFYRFKKYIKERRFWNPCRCWDGRWLTLTTSKETWHSFEKQQKNLPLSRETRHSFKKQQWNLNQTWKNLPLSWKNLGAAKTNSVFFWNLPWSIDFIDLKTTNYNFWQLTYARGPVSERRIYLRQPTVFNYYPGFVPAAVIDSWSKKKSSFACSIRSTVHWKRHTLQRQQGPCFLVK